MLLFYSRQVPYILSHEIFWLYGWCF